MVAYDGLSYEHRVMRHHMQRIQHKQGHPCRSMNDLFKQRRHTRLQHGKCTVRHTVIQCTAENGTWRSLYSPSPGPHKSGYLQVSPIHRIYYEVHGNEQGRPAVFLHGGPGAGCFNNHARFFDLDKWRVVLFDQRGCGRSTPIGCLTDNTTQALVGDIEVLRKHLDLPAWLVLGGSWGVTLALAYAQRHPSAIAGMILRGVCLMRQCEIDWMFRGGVASVQPKGWQDFLSALPREERYDPLLGYYRRLTSDDATVRAAAAKSWSTFEAAVSMSGKSKALQVWDGLAWAQHTLPRPNGTVIYPPSGSIQQNTSGGNHKSNGGAVVDAAGAQGKNGGAAMGAGMAQALLTAHYSLHGAFLRETPLLAHMDRVRGIPCIAVQGRMDFVCPVRTAWDLHTSWPEMELQVVPEGAHSMYDPPITHQLVEATDRMLRLHEARWAQPQPAGWQYTGPV